MRLGQLARKLTVRPAEIVDFLLSRKITIEDNANSRLENSHVELVIQKFSPGTRIEPAINEATETDELLELPHEAIQVPNQDVEIRQQASSEIPEAADEKQEVIKAPKIELQGLKVLGKIELPDPKKREQTVAESSGAVDGTSTQVEAPRQPLPIRRAPARKESTAQRKNPIALARELEQTEARKKREEEAEYAKEQRTKNYYKRVKVSSPTKRARFIDEQSEEIVTSEQQAPSKSWFVKLTRWFKT